MTSRRIKESRKAYPAACRRVEERSSFRCEAETPECDGRPCQHHHRRSRSVDLEHETLIFICFGCHMVFIHGGKHLTYGGPDAYELGLILPLETLEADPWVPPSERKAA